MHGAIQSVEVCICRGKPADATELADFAARTFKETYSADNKPEDMRAHIDANFGPDLQAAELSDPAVITILGRSCDGLVAYAQVRRSIPPSCVTHAAPVELHRLYVDRRAHGSGLASRLIPAIHEATNEFEGRHIWLSVWEKNARAIAFYKRAGFVDVGTTVFMVGPDRQVDRVMVAGHVKSPQMRDTFSAFRTASLREERHDKSRTSEDRGLAAPGPASRRG